MSYSNYLKRVNRYGNSLQERIQNKREHDFLVMMEKSPNKVDIREDLSQLTYEGVLQTHKYDEDEVVDYLLVPVDQKIALGTVMWVTDIRHNQRDFPFLNYAIDPYTTQGYNRYTVIELEETLYWVKDGIEHQCPCHAAGGGSGARDKNINLKFRMQFSEGGIYLPNKRYSLVLPLSAIVADNTGRTKDIESQMLILNKNDRVTLGRKVDAGGGLRLHGETWRVTGYDIISVDGVVYMTLEEAQTDKEDDIPIADKIQVDRKKDREKDQPILRVREGESIIYTLKTPLVSEQDYVYEKKDAKGKLQLSIFGKSEDGVISSIEINGVEICTDVVTIEDTIITVNVISMWMEG